MSLQPTDIGDADDQALWAAITRSAERTSFQNYHLFVGALLCPDELTESEWEALEERGLGVEGGPKLTGSRTAEATWRRLRSGTFLPYPGVEAYRALKGATEAFLIANCGVALEPTEFGRLGIEPGSSTRADHRAGRDVAVPTTDAADADRSVFAPLIPREKLGRPCFLELIWSYWHEEGMLVRTLDAISRRFQNRRGSDPDPLREIEIDPLRPLGDLLWGYIQDEPHRLTVARRAYEYDHHYGLALTGRAVPAARDDDGRSRLLAALHAHLASTARFCEQDDAGAVGDASPVLGSLLEVHLILSEGAHNQFGDLPSTSRQEMLMQQWLLARPELARFLLGPGMVAYPEPWMGQVDAVKRVQAWGDTPVRQFRDLAVAGEQILLSIRFGTWADETDGTRAARWARYWREEVRRYIHAYRAVAGVDLGVGSVA
jgi:hypothetical protein